MHLKVSHMLDGLSKDRSPAKVHCRQTLLCLNITLWMTFGMLAAAVILLQKSAVFDLKHW